MTTQDLKPIEAVLKEKSNSTKKFSIFNPAITFEHREFYEEIHTLLNGLFPICSQGISTAVEISESKTEQQQVADLMEQIERFAENLISVTKELFNQFYQAKEDLYTGIFGTIASNKINLIDRNLLERTCDVRWWAMETAFCDCIECVLVIREQKALLQEILAEYDNESIDLGILKKLLEKDSQLIGNGDRRQQVLDILSEALNKLKNKKGVKLAREKLSQVQKMAKSLYSKIDFACARLEDINNSYTLYRDLVIVSKEGYIIANSNKHNRSKILGLRVNHEEWFTKALETDSGNEYCVQDIAKSHVEEQLSLVYSTAIRKNSDENGEIIGVMGVFFDFQGEAKLILEDYMPRDQYQDILEGFYSMFTNNHGVIIGSSDEIILENGSFAHIPKSHRSLTKGEKHFSYAVFEGTESAILSSKTAGYLDYKGLGWNSHMIIPKKYIFDNKNRILDQSNISDTMLNSSCLIPEINHKTYDKVDDDKESIQLISLNGIVLASKLGKRGAALDPIFKQITKTATFATKKIEELLREMATGVLELFSQALENLTKQAIDLIDRNLFERSADIRWWATDQYFWNALQHPSEENFNAAAHRLRVINSSYTMYRNLVLVDAHGDFVACSKNEYKNELKLKNYADRGWFQEGMRMVSSGNYYVEDVAASDLESKKETSLIYAGGVRENGSRDAEVVGVLAIFFDWDTEAKLILESCLPRGRKGSAINGIVAFYTNAEGVIIETTDNQRFAVGTKIDLHEQFAELNAGESTSGFVTYNDKQYLMGSSKTKGYREYDGLKWCAHILRPVY